MGHIDRVGAGGSSSVSRQAVATFLSVTLCIVGSARARQGETPPAPSAPPPSRTAQGADEQRMIPPPVILGLRSDLVRTKLKVRPTVVIVRSPDDYARMIAAWSLGERYPVLIDDGSRRAREDIARFVRAFAPKSVVRWASADGVKLPTDAESRAATFDAVWRAAWDARTPEELEAIWKQTAFTAPGVVVSSPFDTAWTAAIALAAGRGQNIIWVNQKPSTPSSVLPDAELASLDSAIRSGIEALRPVEGWKAVGDQIDAVTLCLNIGSRISSPDGELALTDHIGRMADGSRYAWCGMIFGDEARAAYCAMCALYLQPVGAWVFDGYKAEFAPPYHLEKAVEMLDKAGLRLSTNLPPRAGIEEWRERSRFGVAADFVHVNSSGHSRFFDLNPGRGFPSDVPPLSRPAMVHFIHSFSAQFIADADTVGGRWIENGAYAYVGSVHEPFLSAFLPGHAVVARLWTRAPWGAAVRQDGGKAWKINVFGDPLLTVGPPAPRHDEPLMLEGAVSLDDEMRTALKARKMSQGLAALVLLGRDKDVVRLAQAAFNPDAAAMDPQVAAIALTAAFRERDAELFMRLYHAMAPGDQREMLNADMLWRIARPSLSTADEKLITLLRETIRPHSMADDASALASSISRLYGADAVKPFIAGLAARAPDPKSRQDLIELSNKF